jgi:hypothetical protein
MKKLLIIAVALLLGFLMASAAWYYSKLKKKDVPRIGVSGVKKALMRRLNVHAQQMQSYASHNGYNANICFLLDMHIESGRNRFFIYDMKKDSIVEAGLVTHGRCNQNWLNGRQYGNKIGCGCTSLGKYKIGKPYKGRFGLAYKLYGLDSTNNNAYNRFVVLHSHSCVPNAEVHPYPICQSDGCPTVSPPFLNKLAGIIDQSSKPILLFTFDN